MQISNKNISLVISKEEIINAWHKFSLIVSLNALLFFGLLGFYNMFFHGQVRFVEPNRMIASMEFLISLVAVTGIISMITQNNANN